MDSDELRYLLGKCIHLKHYFYGVFALFCELFCVYIEHVMFGYKYPLMLNMNDNDLLRFANHML